MRPLEVGSVVDELTRAWDPGKAIANLKRGVDRADAHDMTLPRFAHWSAVLLLPLLGTPLGRAA